MFLKQFANSGCPSSQPLLFFGSAATASQLLAAEPAGGPGMAGRVAPTNQELQKWLQQQALTLVPHTSLPPGVFASRPFTGLDGGFLFFSSKRFDFGSLEQELEILKLLAAEPCRHLQLPLSWRAWGAPAPTTAFAVQTPLATFKKLITEQKVDVALAARAALHVAKALQHLHLRRLLHGDLRDECVWLASEKGKMVVKVAHFNAAVSLKPGRQAAAEPSKAVSPPTVEEPVEAVEPPTAGCFEPPAAKKQKQSQPLLMSILGKRNAPETWPQSCGGGLCYDEAVDIWALGWLP